MWSSLNLAFYILLIYQTANVDPSERNQWIYDDLIAWLRCVLFEQPRWKVAIRDRIFYNAIGIEERVVWRDMPFDEMVKVHESGEFQAYELATLEYAHNSF